MKLTTIRSNLSYNFSSTQSPTVGAGFWRIICRIFFSRSETRLHIAAKAASGLIAPATPVSDDRIAGAVIHMKREHDWIKVRRDVYNRLLDLVVCYAQRGRGEKNVLRGSRHRIRVSLPDCQQRQSLPGLDWGPWRAFDGASYAASNGRMGRPQKAELT